MLIKGLTYLIDSFFYIVSTCDNKSVSFAIFTIKQLVDFFKKFILCSSSYY